MEKIEIEGKKCWQKLFCKLIGKHMWFKVLELAIGDLQCMEGRVQKWSKPCLTGPAAYKP